MKRLLGNIYPLSVHKELAALKKAERLPEEEVLKLQSSGLTQLLQHASEKVPYYRRILIESSVLKDGKVVLDNFRQVPFLTKEILRTHWDELRSADIRQRKFYYNTSGGSTGEPVRFVQDLEYKHWVRAEKLLFDKWTGYYPGMPKIALWGSERDFLAGRETLRVRLNRWLKNEVWINTFSMTETNMLQHIEAINHHEPVQILAYVESIYELARFIEKEGVTVHSPKAIMTSAGTLYPNMRQVIYRTFQAPIFNRYGSREVGDIACECETHQGLHVSPLTHYVEIISEDGCPTAPGELGEVVVTSLVNYAMPLIRYRIGDVGVWAEEECSCGRKWPLLKEVSGRVNSIIRTKKGAYDSVALSTLLYFKDAKKTQPFMSFSRYQLVQKAPNCVVLKVVIQDPKLWENEQVTALMKLQKTLGEDVNIQIEAVNEIAPSPSGKHHYIWSEIT